MNELKAFLESVGFRVYPNTMKSAHNTVTWYAARRLKGARECETNDHKVQLIVWPHEMEFQDRIHSGVECDITGEANGVWFKLQAYGMSPSEFIERLDEVEAGLLKAWNSLKD